MPETIGFIGVGTMGKPMATNLLKAGHQLTVFDLNTAAVAGADVAITMVPASAHVEAAVLGPGGVLEGLKPGRTLIEMSTIDPMVSRKVASLAAERGIKVLDAPVSGSLPRAIDGTLTIMVGGPKDVFDACLPILEVMGANVIHCGEAGMGEVVKLCNNLIAAISQIAASEAFAMGVAAGADPKIMHRVITSSSGDCWVVRTRPPYPDLVGDAPVDQGWAPGFMTDLMLKDVGLALGLARSVGTSSLLGAIAQQLYGAASDAGHGRDDFSAVDFAVRALGRREG